MKATLTVFAAAVPRASTRAAGAEARAAAVSATTPRSSAPRVQRPVMSLTLRGRGWASEPETRFRCRFYASGPRLSRPAVKAMAGNLVAGRVRLGGLLDRLFGLFERAAGGDERRAVALRDRLFGDHALGDVAAGRELEHDVEQRRLDDRAQAACTGLPLERLVGDLPHRVVGEDELDVVIPEKRRPALRSQDVQPCQ